MNIELIFIHAILAMVLFLCMNWIGKHSINAGYIQMSVFVKTDEAPAFNFLYRSFAPVVFITLVSAACYVAKQDWVVTDIYMVVVYHAVFRLGFNILTGRARLLNWGIQIAYILLSVGASYYVYSNLILDKSFFFPEPKDIGNALWLGIIGFIYHTCNSVRLSEESTKRRKRNYLSSVYQNYSQLYGETIKSIVESQDQESLVYAVLIYENFNRPKAYRLVENVLFYLGFAKTLGIMQVTTDKYINDLESVVLGCEKIVKDFELAKKHNDAKYGDWSIRREVLKAYNPDIDYIYEVDRIHEDIKQSFYQEDVEQLEAESC